MSTLKVNNIESFSSSPTHVQLNDQVGVSGSLQVSGSITPNGNNNFDLGSNDKQWKDLYVDGTAHIDAFSLAGDHNLTATNGLFTLSGSQIFSSSAFPGSEGAGGSPAIFLDASMSASLFVFKKA